MTAADLLPFSGRTGLLIACAVGLANFLTILTVIRALAPRDMLTARAHSHAKRREELRAARIAPRRKARRRTLSAAKQLVARLKLDSGKEAVSAAERLAQAGWRSPDATAAFLALRLVAPVLLGLVGFLVGPAVLHHTGLFPHLMGGVAGIAAGAYAPTILVTNQIQKRAQKIQRGLPDALDLFVICTEAGVGLDAAMGRVSREIGASAPELADELGLTAIELGFLPDRREALQNLSRRVTTPGVRGLVSTLVQTERYGTPLAHALRVLAAEFRDTRLMKAEEKAARLPATLTVPMILFILPPLFVVLLGPAIIQVLHTPL